MISSIKESYSDGKEELKALRATYADLMNGIGEKTLPEDHYTSLQKAIDESYSYSKFKTHLMSINGIHDEIILNNYPDYVQFYFELTEEQKKKLITDESAQNIHKHNQQWICTNFFKEELSQPSQNQTAKRVQELYHKKFKKRIGATTILRYVGRSS